LFCWSAATNTSAKIARVLSLVAGLLTGASALRAQSAPQRAYYDQLPPLSKRIAQTEASTRFELFGDRAQPDYRDVEPADGVDDERGARLLALAHRFSPILRRNNFSRPIDFLAGLDPHAWVRVDGWKAGMLVSSDSVALSGPVPRGQRVLASGADQKLAELLRIFSPAAAPRTVEPAEGARDTVLYIDYPGGDERSWRRVHRSQSGLRTYVHPFVDEDRNAGEDRYALVLQYWFFYPFNDGANNHEGDWEHLNVTVTTRERESAPTLHAARMSDEEMRRVLSGSLPLDSLTIAAVEYYFHETYATLDYVAVRRDPLQKRRLPALRIWDDPDLVQRTIRDRLRAERIANHPIGYIGGNNRGPDELTKLWPRFHAGYNRNGHGTYPFPGTWQAVGPLGLTEQLSGDAVPAHSLRADSTLVFDDDHFMAFQSSDLILVPDWERVWPAMLDDAGLRGSWAWLILPLRWGYPASRSPGAGAIKHVDLGNISPEGPAFQPTWNRLGPATGWRSYDLNALRVLLVPTMPWARVRNGWGILNLPVGLLGLMPGWNVLTSLAIRWAGGSLHLFGAPPANTFYPMPPPFRFASTATGLTWLTDVQEFARLLPAAAAESQETPSASTFAGSVAVSASQRYWLNVFYGRRLSVENTLTLSRMDLSGAYIDDGTSALDLVGQLHWRELTSGFRLNAFSTNDDGVQYYSRAGWGYTWYELRDLTIGGESANPRFDGGYPPSLFPSSRWWPNTWYLGAGLELFRPKRHGWFQRVGVGARVEGAISWHHLALAQPSTDLGWNRHGDIAVSLLLAW
jgi:hypothetical protein